VIHVPARPAAEVNPRVPPGLQPILDRALAKEPRDRFPTMAAMRDELRALQRRLAREEGLGAPAPWSREVVRRPRSYFAVGQRLGRVLGRFRPAPGAREPPESAPPAEASTAPAARPSAWGSESGKTLAVLPFRNLAADPQAAFYEFALADALITELGQVRGLVVRPSAYVSLYAGRHWDPRQVGEELAVSSVLAGGFVRTPDQFRVTAQLVDTASGQILWSEKIDVPGRDLLTIQDAIADRLVGALRLTLTPEEQDRIERRPTLSPEAYEFYLKGRDLLFRYVLKTYDEADLESAIKAFHEAVGLDSTFAAAHAALGRCYVHQTQGWAEPESFYLAERSLRAALELDPSLVEARLFLVHVDLHHGDKERARRIVADLLRQAPNDPEVLFVAGMLYRLDGLYEKALAVYARLLTINPRDVVIVAYNRARIRSFQQRYDDALSELERARAVEPDHPLVKTFLAHVLFNLGRVDEAQELVEDVLRLHPALDGVQPVLAWCLSVRGEHERARGLITLRVRAAAHADPDVAFWLACFYAMEGLTDEALDWLRRAVRLGNENYPLFAASAKLGSLKGEPRFEELLEDLRKAWEARL
jgi:serine/threonine-protein kinase